LSLGDHAALVRLAVATLLDPELVRFFGTHGKLPPRFSSSGGAGWKDFFSEGSLWCFAGFFEKVGRFSVVF